MLDRLKNLIFPCEKKMKELRENHKKAALANMAAHQRLLAVCHSSGCGLEQRDKRTRK